MIASRNIFHGFHHGGEKLSVSWFAGRERNSTVPYQCRSHPMPTYRGHIWIPPNLGIQVGVHVDKSRTNYLARSINRLPRFAFNLTNRDYATISNCKITSNRLRASPVDYRTAFNNNVVHDSSLHRLSLSSLLSVAIFKKFFGLPSTKKIRIFSLAQITYLRDENVGFSTTKKQHIVPALVEN